MALVLSLIILLLAVCVLGLWGTTNAATALTLATTNAVEQTTIAVLTCALLAGLPLVLFGAFKLGEALGEHKRAVRDPVSAPLIEVRMPHQGISPERVDVPAFPRSELPALPSGVSVIRAPHTSRRARARVQAMRIAQRWFR